MELAVHQVRYGRSPFVRNSRFGPPTAPVAAYQPIASHEPGDPLAAAVDASVTQLIEHPRHPIGVATQLVDLSDRAEQLPVGQLPVGRWPFAPCPEAAGGDIQHPTEPGDAMVGPFSLYELKPHDGVSPVSWAK